MKGTPYLVRYQLDLERMTVHQRQIISSHKPASKMAAANHFDFPQINERFRFHRYCYVYGVAMRSDGKHLGHMSLVKKDLCGGKKDKVVQGRGLYFQEPQFVARPNAVAEDDGALIVFITDGVKKRSYVAIYDALTMELDNKAILPTILPFSLHGSYFPGQL